MAKLSTFIIMLILVSLVMAAGFGALMGSFHENVGLEQDYNESKIEAYNKLDEISQDTKEIKDSTNALRSRSGVFDALGSFFESAFQSLSLATKSITLFDIMKSQALDDLGLSNANVFAIAIGAIIIILIFMGVIIKAVTKTDV